MLVLALLLGSCSLDHIIQGFLAGIPRPPVAERLQALTWSHVCDGRMCVSQVTAFATGHANAPMIVLSVPVCNLMTSCIACFM